MASYVAMEPAAGEAGAGDRAVLVRDGFSVLAFILPVVWLLWRRLWLEAILVLAIGVALVAITHTAGIGLAAGAASLLVSIYVGLEGQALRIAAMRRRGWRECAVVEAGTMADAEIRYLAGVAMQDGSAQRTAPETERRHAPGAPPRTASSGAASSGPAPYGPALGMLGYPGRH